MRSELYAALQLCIQADLSLHRAHSLFVGFVMMRLMYMTRVDKKNEAKW